MKCLLCNSEKRIILSKVESFGIPLVYYQCGNCGLVFQDSEESIASDPKFYDETYRKIYQVDENPTAKDLWVQKERAKHLLGVMRGFGAPEPKRVLDIGASTGTLLKAFSAQFACNVTGVEPGEAYRSYAEQRNIRMFPSIESLLACQPGKFDVVSLMHVLEHLPDPVGTLRLIRAELINSGGILLIEVPNFYGHDSYELAHLACFTPHTLRETLKRAGFKVSTLKRHGVPRSSILPLYLTVVAEPLPEAEKRREIKPERFVRLKRNFGLFFRRVVQKLFPNSAWLPISEESES